MPAPPAFTTGSNFPLHPGFAPLIGSPPNTLLPRRLRACRVCSHHRCVSSGTCPPVPDPPASGTSCRGSNERALTPPSFLPGRCAAVSPGRQDKPPGATKARSPGILEHHSVLRTVESPRAAHLLWAELVVPVRRYLHLLRRGFTGLNVVSPLKPTTAHARRLPGIEYSYNESAAGPSFQHRNVASS